MLPNVTIYSGNLKPDVRCAPAPVLAQRQQFFASDASKQTGSGTYSIESKVRLVQGREAMLSAVFRMGSVRIPVMTYTILRWKERVVWQ
ncbi:hypothetical protein AF72_12810 [Xylella taiwanensis]|nr:hypothetical protein AF72_12810 [Xylella taiwanensis]